MADEIASATVQETNSAFYVERRVWANGRVKLAKTIQGHWHNTNSTGIVHKNAHSKICEMKNRSEVLREPDCN